MTWCFFLISFRTLFLHGIWQFEYKMWVYFTSTLFCFLSLGFLNVRIHVFHSFGEVFCHYFFAHFFCHLLSFFPFWDSYKAYIFMLDGVREICYRSIRLCSVFSLFCFYNWAWIVSLFYLWILSFPYMISILLLNLSVFLNFTYYGFQPLYFCLIPFYNFFLFVAILILFIVFLYLHNLFLSFPITIWTYWKSNLKSHCVVGTCNIKCSSLMFSVRLSFNLDFLPFPISCLIYNLFAHCSFLFLCLNAGIYSL